jgi:hypothetical protein
MREKTFVSPMGSMAGNNMAEQNKKTNIGLQAGQSLVEYTLIVVLCIFAFAFALAATGPALGNVFSNTIFALIGQDDQEIVYLPDRDEFWLTVTWVASYTPTPGRRLATPTPPASTPQPTDGPSPTPTPVTPSPTPSETWTPTPSPTVTDIPHVAPWTDSANNDQVINWRLDNLNSYFGSEDWHFTLYNNTTFTAPAMSDGTGPLDRTYPGENQKVFGDSFYQRIDFNWASGSPVTGGPVDNFSIQWRRPIYLRSQTTLQFDLTNVQNMAVRVWILGGAYGGDATHRTGVPGTCTSRTTVWNSSLAVRSNNPTQTSNLAWRVFGDTELGYSGSGAPPTECLLIDRWTIENTARSAPTVRRTVPSGRYLLMVEYIHGTGQARPGTLNVRNVANKINFDDSRVNSSGVPVAGAPDCGWGNLESTRADTASFTWEEYRNGDFRGTTVCYLELRGYVEIPASMTNPHFEFWDAWDVRSNVDMWLEVADYDPDNNGLGNYLPDITTGVRPSIPWQRVMTRTGDTFNYNWTYNAIDLTSIVNATTSRKLTFRFGMRRSENTNFAMRWYIDTMKIDNLVRPDQYMNKLYRLNNTSELSNFITSGRWELISGGVGNGLVFHESASGNTVKFDESRNGASSFADGDLRIHSVEFNGFIDLDNPLGTTDMDGDQGDPALTFMHRYALGNRTGLEIQYSTTPYGAGPATWIVVPNGGQLIVRNNTSAEPVEPVFTEVTVNLKDIPVRRFRLRFAMLVNINASQRDGWWIDEIKLERVGRKRYLKYPYVDTAEDPALLPDNYALSGTWDRVAGGWRPPVNETGFSYTDSPGANYVRNTTNTITWRATFDLFNDTPENPYSPACNLVPSSLCEDDNPLPVRPQLSFWHRRVIGAGVTIAVDWKLTDENNTQWKTLWQYADGHTVRSVSGFPSTDGTRARRQEAWEKVVVDLTPIFTQILTTTPTARTNAPVADDDINLRIRFQIANNVEADGIYLDEIRIEEYTERVWALWDAGQTRNNIDGSPVRTNGVNVLGNGITYEDSVERSSFGTPAFFNLWDVGGHWNAVSFEQRDGVLSFHDSTTDISSGTNRAPNFANPQGTNGIVPADTFNVLEMKTILDLRGVAVSDRPILYFWSRWFAENNRDFFAIQVSVEDPTNSQVGCPTGAPTPPQCYDKLFGWGPWQTVWSTTGTREYLWERRQIDLVPYARSAASNGSRIRIRFITDALDASGTGSNRGDGFYIDQMLITYFAPPTTVIGKSVAAGGSFSDSARSTDNWIMEGKWGLTPTLFRGSGGGPASLGGNPWQFRVWDYDTIRTRVTNCGSISFRDCANTFLNVHANTTTPWHQGFVVDIRENWAGGGPRNASFQQITNRFVYRWEMTTPANLVPGRMTFITSADDGVRLDYQVVPAVGAPPAPTWNIVNNWQEQGRTTTVASADIAGLTSYKFTMEYFEATGDASVQLSLGSFFFSFTSQPPEGSGQLESQQVATMRNSNASMIYRGLFDLRQATNPVINYYTFYELGGVGYVEVSEDGGFTWQQTGLQGSAAPNSIWATNWYGYYWTGRELDFPAGGWPSPAPNFSTQPYTGFNGSPRVRDEGTSINYNWSGAPGVTGIGSDNFSVRFIRKLNTTDFTTLTFTVRGDDGYRLWVNYSPGCSSVGATQIFSGGPNAGRRNSTFPDPNAGCIIIDDWETQGPETRTATRTVPPGATIMLDYFEATGGAVISLDVIAGSFSSPNISGVFMPDDTPTRDWQLRTHDLSYYAGPGKPPIMLRFRLDRLNETSEDINPNNDNGNLFNYKVAWWITDIVVFEP